MIKSLATRAIAAAAMAVGVAAAGAVQAQTTVSDILHRGEVRIGVLVGAPPFGSIDLQGKPAGYDTDVAKQVGKYFGVKTKLIPLTPPARIPALESHKVDFLISTLAPTAERAKAVWFSIPYNAFQVAIWGHKNAKINDWSDLKGLRVGVNRGSSVEPTLVAHHLNVVRFQDDSTTMQALFSGQVDAVAEPIAQAHAALKAHPSADMVKKFVFSTQPNSMAVNEGDYDLLRYLNNLIYLMKNDGKLNAISEKWVGVPLPNLPVF